MRRLAALLLCLCALVVPHSRAAAQSQGQAVVVVMGGAPVAAWTPKKAANGYGWWRADLGVTIATGVSAWADQLAVQPNAVQATGSAQPVQTANQVNGQTAIVFTGSSSQVLSITSFVKAPTDAEWWFVLKSTATGSSPFFETSGAQDYYPFSNISYPSQDLYMGLSSTLRKTCGNAITDIRSYHVMSVQSSASAWTLWLNGSQQYTTATNVVGNVSSTAYIGAGTNIGTGYLTGGIAEIWYGRIMSTSDRAKARAYITKRYGLSLGSSWE
jgi:hypothetical protein